MLWFILFPIWFAYHAKRDNKNPILWAIIGFVATFIAIGFVQVIGRKLFSYTDDRSIQTIALLGGISQTLPLFCVVLFGFYRLNIEKNKIKKKSNKAEEHDTAK